MLKISDKVAETLDLFESDYPEEDLSVILYTARAVADKKQMKEEHFVDDAFMKEEYLIESLQIMYDEVQELILRAGYDIDGGRIVKK